MADTNQGSQAGAPLWRRRTFWLGGGALAGLAALGAAAPRAWAFRGLHATFGHAVGHGRGVALALLKDPQAAKERAGTAVEWALRGDARLLRRLVRNLLDNARRHAGGSEVEARVERTAAGARLVVADRGPGVPDGERERIFEPFYRPPGTPESGSGYGLGLALVRQIARAHGGEVLCLPRPGGGTEFEVVIER